MTNQLRTIVVREGTSGDFTVYFFEGDKTKTYSDWTSMISDIGKHFKLRLPKTKRSSNNG